MAGSLPEDFAAQVNRFLDRDLAALIRERAVPRLADPAIYSLSAGGKRLRPVLCLLAAGVPAPKSQALDSIDDYTRAALLVGAALECIHTYSLIHDDLPAMDDDDLRRGRPSCHVEFGEWAAILAGDALNTFAFELLGLAFAPASEGSGSNGSNNSGGSTEPVLSAMSLPAALRVLAEAAGMAGMVGGQTLDLDFEKNSNYRDGQSPDDRQGLLRQIHLKKTTALIRASLELGAVLSGADRAAYRTYGEKLGLLFQISDDLLDRTGTSESLGKTPGKDEAAGKLTYPALYGMDRTREIAADLASEARAAAAALEQGSRASVDHRSYFNELPDQILHRDR